MKELVARIESAVAKYRLTFGNEAELQGQLSEVLAYEGIVFEREFVVSAGERPDFWVQDLLRPPSATLANRHRHRGEGGWFGGNTFAANEAVQ
jgi:hypothetical protein